MLNTGLLSPLLMQTKYKTKKLVTLCPIALASVFSKMIEVIILARIEIFLDTNPNQFGFKKKHGTDQCIYVLKEIID